MKIWEELKLTSLGLKCVGPLVLTSMCESCLEPIETTVLSVPINPFFQIKCSSWQYFSEADFFFLQEIMKRCASHSQRFSCLCLLGTGIKGVRHHTQLICKLFKDERGRYELGKRQKERSNQPCCNLGSSKSHCGVCGWQRKNIPVVCVSRFHYNPQCKGTKEKMNLKHWKFREEADVREAHRASVVSREIRQMGREGSWEP